MCTVNPRYDDEYTKFARTMRKCIRSSYLHSWRDVFLPSSFRPSLSYIPSYFSLLPSLLLLSLWPSLSPSYSFSLPPSFQSTPLSFLTSIISSSPLSLSFSRTPPGQMQRCVIRLYVIKAQNLMPTDYGGFADPYLKVSLGA